MMENPRELLEISESVLKPFGISRSRIRFCIAIPLSMFVFTTLYLAMYGLIFDDMDFDQNMDMICTLTSFSHMTVKIVALMLKRREIHELVERTIQFEDVSNMDYDIKFKQSISRTYRFWWRVLDGFKKYIIIVVTFAIFLAILWGNLVYSVHVPRMVPRAIFMSFNALGLVIGSLCVTGFDCLFCGLIATLIIKLKTLNHDMALIKYETGDGFCYKKRIRTLVEHHNFLLKYKVVPENCCLGLDNVFCCSCVKDTNEVFGLALLFYLGVALFGMCSMIYAESQSDDLGLSIKFGTFGVGIAGQLFWLYCLPTMILNEEISELSVKVYSSNWYVCRDLSLKKCLVLIMARAQNSTTVCAGRIIPLDMTTFTKVFKTTITFYTAIEQMKKRSSQRIN